MTTPPLRIDDIARLAGVSTATVSRALSGSATVRPATRARVEAVASRFAYRPSRLGRNLRSGYADVVGVVVSDIANPHFAALVGAAEDALHSRGFRVLLCDTRESAAKQAAHLEVMAAERVRGVLISPSDPHDPEIARLLELGIRVVAVDRAVADPRASSVTAANAEAARQATRHLIDLGHRSIGFIAGRQGVQTSEERLAGYREAMAEAALEPFHRAGDFHWEGGRAAAAKLLSAKRPATALLVGNNQMTVGALDFLRATRMRVPDDVAIIGFDDPVWFRVVDPAITALAQPVQAMAECAVELLFDAPRQGAVLPRHVVMSFELRIRRSCGSPF
jgi:LacI family transcriptional regulator